MQASDIEARMTEIGDTLESRSAEITEDELTALETEVTTLQERRQTLLEAQTRRQSLLSRVADGTEGTRRRRLEPETRNTEPTDATATIAYRSAFMQYIQTGVMSPQLRQNEQVTVADAGAVIPSTILNEVVRKLGAYGQIFSRVRKTNVPGGVSIPIIDLIPEATWIADGAASDSKKVDSNTSITFNYYGVECKIARSLIVSIVALPVFEATITELITEAMMRALDKAIVKGTGTGQPTGITVDTRIPAGNVVTISAADFGKWSAWKKSVMAKLPIRYKAGAVWLMNSGTFEGYIDGMVDTNGQPIGRVNYGIAEGNQGRFAGKEVIEVEDDVIASYEDAQVGDVVAILGNLGNYDINTNFAMTMVNWIDHDTNKKFNKGIMVADGKVLDPNGFIIVKKGA